MRVGRTDGCADLLYPPLTLSLRTFALSFLLHSQKKAAPKKKKATKKKAAPKKKKATKVRVRSVWCVCECANVRVSVSVLVLVALF